VRLRFHLSALDADDMQGYILHRLEVAGSEGREIFQPETFETIHRYTGGVPRLVNTLCDTALLAASTEDSPVVTAAHLAAAIAELRWVEFAQRPHNRALAAAAAAKDDVESTAPRLQLPGHGPESTKLAKLVLSSNGKLVKEIPVVAGRLMIGRTSANDLQIESRYISRHHCQIISTDTASVIEDLNSTNGVHFRGSRLRQHALNDGDVITMGDHELLYQDERNTNRMGRDTHRETSVTGQHSKPSELDLTGNHSVQAPTIVN
jgi:hypothetical protein